MALNDNTNTEKISNAIFSRSELLITSVMLVVTAVFLIKYQYILLNSIEWKDEFETIVISKMIASGKKLYTGVFSQHGPLVFLPGLILEQIGDFKHKGYRTVIAAGQILALISIFLSPLFSRKIVAGFYTMLAATIMVVYFPRLYGHMYMYHTFCGLLLIIILSQYTLPAIAKPDCLSPVKVILGNCLIGCLPFLSVAYSPIAFCLFLASLRPEFLKSALIYVTASVAANVVFVLLISSIAGYLAIHIYLNLFVYVTLEHTTTLDNGLVDLYYLAMKTAAHHPNNFLLFVIPMLALTRLWLYETRIPWRSVLVTLGIVSLMIRGYGYHALPYYYSFLVLPILFFYGTGKVDAKQYIVAGLVGFVCIAKLALILPGINGVLKRARISDSSEFSQLVQKLTEKEDRIISYPFRNKEYLISERLPASGYIYYLPQQVEYNKNPKLDVLIDGCKEISKYQPKLMLVSQQYVWEGIPWERYGACVQEILDQDYVQVTERPYYINAQFLEQYLASAITPGATVSLEKLMDK